MEPEKQIHSTAKTAEGAQYINSVAVQASAISTAVTAAFAFVAYKNGMTGPAIAFAGGTMLQIGITAFNVWHARHYARHRRAETYARASYRCREAFARILAAPIVALCTFGISAFSEPHHNGHPLLKDQPAAAPAPTPGSGS